jgi:hypothetical protein
MGYFIIIVNLILVFKLFWDTIAKDSGRIINHSLSAAIDGLLYTLSAWVCFGWDAGGWIVLAIGYRWIVFDILFNIINGWKWNHYGTSSKLDKFLLSLGNFHLVPKILLIAIGILLIIFV